MIKSLSVGLAIFVVNWNRFFGRVVPSTGSSCLKNSLSKAISLVFAMYVCQSSLLAAAFGALVEEVEEAVVSTLRATAQTAKDAEKSDEEEDDSDDHPVYRTLSDYPDLLAATATASLYAYPEERTVSLIEKLKEDDWKIKDTSGDWVHFANGDMHMLAFRGTVGLGELVDQAKRFDFTNIFDVKCHDYYVGVYNEVAYQVTRRLSDNPENEHAHFICTGHSKGGVLAELAGLTFNSYRNRKVNQQWCVINYGAPAVFHPSSRKYPQNILEFAIDVDPVVDYFRSAGATHLGLRHLLEHDESDDETKEYSYDDPSGRKGDVTGGGINLAFHKMSAYAEEMESLSLSDVLS